MSTAAQTAARPRRSAHRIAARLAIGLAIALLAAYLISAVAANLLTVPRRQPAGVCRARGRLFRQKLEVGSRQADEYSQT